MFLFAIVSSAKKGSQSPGVTAARRGDGGIHQKCFDNVGHHCADGLLPGLRCVMGRGVLRR